MWQYFETFVYRNPLIRDKILFQALFLDADLEINPQRTATTATCLAHAFVFLEGLPTITAIVEGFGGVPSYNTPSKWLSLRD